MGYREYPVPSRWRGLAECLWTSTAPAAPEVVDVLPDGCMDLVWSGGELFVAGPDTAPHPYERATGRTAVDCGSIPGCCPRCSAYRPTRCATPGCRWRCCSPTRPAARPRCSPTPRTPGPVLAGLVAALPGGPPDPGIRAAAVRLARGAAAADTADALGWTARTLHRRSVAAFGYGPAVLRRVLRFRRAMALLRAGVGPAEVAARTGYADQPHLSRDVRAFAGVSPARVAPSHPR